MRLIVVAILLATLASAGPAPAMTNPQIPGLQVALRARGLYPGPIDGIAGPITVRGVKAFQRKHGLVVDGIAGPRTRRALGRLGRPLFGRRTMRAGVVGWDVSVLQFLLKHERLSPGAIDGRFGPATRQAVRRFQRRGQLVVDGVVGQGTMSALRRGLPPSRSIRGALDYWAARYRLRPSLVRALAWMESGNQADVVSPAGAWGVMQVMPGTWRYVETELLRERVPRTANGNVRVGVAYLHHLLHVFHGRVRLAVGSYYQGPTSVTRHGLFGETRHFVRNVLTLRGRIS